MLRSQVSDAITYTFVSVDERGIVRDHQSGKATCLRVAIGEGQYLDLLALPGGELQMGSPAGEGYDDEKPQHGVAVEPFYLGRFPVTQAQWAAVMGNNKPYRFRGSNKAVHNVSWYEAEEYCRIVTDITGHLFRLPSEAEWEYACRAGTITPFSTGPTIITDLANYNGEFTYARAPKGRYRHVLMDVGVFPPNPFGLHDMHGNLWEWCADPWHENYIYAPQNSRVWKRGGNNNYRVARGGSWHETPDLCRSATRLKLGLDEGDEMSGFRVAMDAQDSPRSSDSLDFPEVN